MIERSMKEISDELLEDKRKSLPENVQRSDEELRDLMGVMRVGALSVNTVLTNETEFMLIMMMKERPTISMLINCAKRLDQKVPHDPDYNFTVKPDVHLGGIEISRECYPPMVIFVQITSHKCRDDYQEEVKAEIPGTPPKIEWQEPKQEKVENVNCGDEKIEPKNEPEVEPKQEPKDETTDKINEQDTKIENGSSESEPKVDENGEKMETDPQQAASESEKEVLKANQTEEGEKTETGENKTGEPEAKEMGEAEKTIESNGEVKVDAPSIGKDEKNDSEQAEGETAEKENNIKEPSKAATDTPPPIKPGMSPLRAPGTPPLRPQTPPFLGTPPPRSGTPPTHSPHGLRSPARMATPPLMGAAPRALGLCIN